MKTLFAVAALFLASSSRAELPCALSEQDYQSLEESASGLTPDQVSTLPPADQQRLCATRELLHKVDSRGGRLEKAERYSPSYLSPAEKSRVSAAVDDVIKRRLGGMGITIV